MVVVAWVAVILFVFACCVACDVLSVVVFCLGSVCLLRLWGLIAAFVLGGWGGVLTGC